jgi:hypothetical protein
MEQNKQGNQSPDTQTKKQENAGQNQQSGGSQNQQSASQNKQGMQNQQPSAKDKPYGSSGTEYRSPQGEDEKNDDRQEEAGAGPVTSRRNESGAGDQDDQDKAGMEWEEKSGSAQRPNHPGQDKGNSQGQQKSGNNQGNTGGQR